MNQINLNSLHVSELTHKQLEETSGGIAPIALEAAMIIVSACYGAGYALGTAIAHLTK